MSKHTPGPWRVGRDGHNILTVATYKGPYGDERSTFVASAYTVNDPSPTFKDCEELEANARLIAAAPTLLAALKRLLACSALGEDAADPETDHALADAWKAVEAAEGRRYG